MKNAARLLEASDFAAKKHKGQTRKGANAEPYINHPLEVATILAVVGNVDDHEILIAAILHDTIEDTETSEAEITECFGEAVCGLVVEVTDDKTLTKAERKKLQIIHAPHLSEGAKQIKIADKISNIEDIIENPPEHWSVVRRVEYIEWCEKVILGVRGANPELEVRFDEATQKARRRLFDRK